MAMEEGIPYLHMVCVVAFFLVGEQVNNFWIVVCLLALIVECYLIYDTFGPPWPTRRNGYVD
jgi:hypothetical protein